MPRMLKGRLNPSFAFAAVTALLMTVAGTKCVHREELDGRHAIDWGGILWLPLNQRCGDVVTVAHAFFDCIGRRHAVAAFVKNAAGQKCSGLAPSLIVIDPVLVELALNRFK